MIDFRAITLLREICVFYQSMDRNGAFLDDWEERTSTIESILSDLEYLSNLTEEWYSFNYITQKEYSVIMGKIKEAISLLI